MSVLFAWFMSEPHGHLITLLGLWAIKDVYDKVQFNFQRWGSPDYVSSKVRTFARPSTRSEYGVASWERLYCCAKKRRFLHCILEGVN